MALISPQNGAIIGGITRLDFQPPVLDINIKVNAVNFHAFKDDKGCTLDLNSLLPDTGIQITITSENSDGVDSVEQVTVYKPRHDLGGMGATVIRDASQNIIGTFFKFWLPAVCFVYIRGAFNEWKDVNRLNQLGTSGYWYGFSQDAMPGDDYMFFVYGADGKFDEVSDPAARDTIKTRYNDPDVNDANAVIIDPGTFRWLNDETFAARRKDFRKHIIYQVHWGTFLRPGTGGDLAFETFVSGDKEEAKRNSVRTKLLYIQKLGFTVLQLLPVHESNGNFNAGYDPSFFFAIESAYGDPDDLRMLIDEAHGLGLAVIVDLVINHLTKDESHSSFSQDFIKGWYTRENAPWSNHNQWGGEDWGPDPDFDRIEIQNLLTDCARMYFDEFQVDGIRFDSTTTIPSQALIPMIGKLQQDYAFNGKYLIAEHLTDNPFPYIIGEVGFNAVWYKPAWDASTYRVLGQIGQGDLAALQQIFETDHNGYASTAVKYLLGSHDEVWSDHNGTAAITRFGGSGNFFARSKARLAWAINVCALCTPMMFMGTDLLTDISWDNYYGYNGKNQHTSGDGINWFPDPESDAGRFQKMIADINRLHTDLGAFSSDNIFCKLVHEDFDNSVAAYKRWDNFGCVLLIIINLSDNQWEKREYQLNTDTPNTTWIEIFNSQNASYGGWSGSGNSDENFHPVADNNGKLQGINIPKWSLMIFKCNI